MNYEPSKIIEEAEKAEEARDIFLACMEPMIERAHGAAYRSDKGDGNKNPDNHEHDVIQHILPQIAFSNPRIRAKGRAGELSRQIAKAFKYGLNRWCDDQKLYEVNQAVCLDGLFTYGVFLTTNQPVDWERANDYESPHLPVVRRLDPRQFLMDPLCGDYRFARWMGHDTVWDVDELDKLAMQPNSGWDPDLVASLSSDKDDIEWRDKKLRSTAPDRNECIIREIWCPGSYLPGYGPENGFHGTIYTVARGQAELGSMYSKDSWIRQPRPYWGPPWGMYTIFGVYRVPGIPFPLGPLCVQKPAADELNEIGRVIDKGVRDYKRITFMDAADAEQVQKRKAAKNGDYVAIRGFRRDSVITEESGGITEQQLVIYQQKQARLNRIASMSETLRGNASGSKTATAESIADQANEITVGWVRERFTKSVTQVVDTAGWYLYNDPSAQIELGEDAAAELGMSQPTFFGDPQGMMGAQLGLDGPAPIGEYRDVVEISIESDSMNMVTSAMQRAQGLEMMDRCLQMFPMMTQLPMLPWKDIGAYLSDLYNDERPGEWFAAAAQVSAQMVGLPGAMPMQPELQYAGTNSTAAQKQPTQPQVPGLTGPLQLAGGDGAFMAQNRPMAGKVNPGGFRQQGAVA